ncbi:unnamed protein product [Danaus chrysippus]|uniref:(African queen) hypothetical protein n=1 Tax=Danaus chrysippus TaxID=151541 RepID=A0A8J2QQ59_9NEOP|nr:unnamed protein product [Danaus chrysippus]
MRQRRNPIVAGCLRAFYTTSKKLALTLRPQTISISILKHHESEYKDAATRDIGTKGGCLCEIALISLRSLNQGRHVSKVGGRSPRERFKRITVPGGAGADSLVVVCRVTRVNQQRHARNRTSSSLPPPSSQPSPRIPRTAPLVRPRRLCQL